MNSKLTHANVIFAAIAPDVVGHLKPEQKQICIFAMSFSQKPGTP